MSLSQRSAEQYSPSSQEQPDSPLLRIRYITLCARMGLKSGCLQRKNVRYRKHSVWGCCSPESTQLSRALTSKLAMSPAGPCQWEMLGWHPPKPGGSPQCSGTSPGANQPRHRAISSCHFQFKSCPQLWSKVGCWKAGASHMQRRSTVQAGVEREREDTQQGASGGHLLKLRKMRFHCTMLLTLLSGEAGTSCICLGMKRILRFLWKREEIVY